MAVIWRSFVEGWRVAAGLWPVVVLLYLVDTALALALAFPPAAYLAEVFGHSTMASRLLGPATLEMLVELQEGGQVARLPWPLYLLMPPLYLLVGTFLRGGTLEALAAGPGAFRWAGFLRGCARHFGRFLLLLLLFLPGLVVVGVLLIVAGVVLALLPLPPWAAELVLTGALVFLLFLLLTWLDYARIGLVLRPRDSLFRHAWRALAFLLRRSHRVVPLGLAFALVAAILFVASPALLWWSPLFHGLLPSLAAQQAVALLASWQRVAMLGGEMALYRTWDSLPPGSLDHQPARDSTT